MLLLEVSDGIKITLFNCFINNLPRQQFGGCTEADFCVGFYTLELLVSLPSSPGRLACKKTNHSNIAALLDVLDDISIKEGEGRAARLYFGIRGKRGEFVL